MGSVPRGVKSLSRAIVGGMVTVVMLLTVPPGWSSTEGNPPQAGVSIPQGLSASEKELFRKIFGGAGDWAPEGTPIADSGFRPYPNGFSFLNFGSSLYLNQRFLGQPEPLARNGKPVSPINMDSRDMRLVFGDGVCVTGEKLNPKGPCELTESALAIVELSQEWSKVGRCYGFVTVAAGLFNGIISPAALRTGEVNAMTTLSSPTQRALSRTVISQYFSATGTKQTSMAELIRTLRESLSSGRTPYSLLIFGQPGGHAVLPYAVLDRGNALFDIAIYDPNFPQQARALRVNVDANTWNYESPALPGNNSSLSWSSADGPSSAIWLGDVASGLTKQECPFCRLSINDTRVAFTPLLRENANAFQSIKLLHPDGRPLDPSLYEILPVADQANEELVSPPAIRVQSGIDFVVTLNGSNVLVPQALTMTVIRPGEIRRVDLEDLAPQVRSHIRIGAQPGVAQVISEPVKRVRIIQTLELNPSSYRFASEVIPRRGSVNVTLRVDPNRKRAVLRNGSQDTQKITLRLRSRTAEGDSNFVVRGISLPPGAKFVARFANWVGPTGRPTVWLNDGEAKEKLIVRVPKQSVAAE
ncbi:MAG: hypothetical protein WAO33_02340 [Candidatus Nanopelagicales bacterium]